MAKAFKSRVNPKHLSKPLAGTAHTVIVPAANLLGGLRLIYSFTYMYEWAGHSFLVTYFPYFVTLVNHFSHCSHCVQQQSPALNGWHVCNSSSTELLCSGGSCLLPSYSCNVFCLLGWRSRRSCANSEFSLSCCLHNNYKRYQGPPLFSYSICILYTLLEMYFMEIWGL